MVMALLGHIVGRGCTVRVGRDGSGVGVGVAVWGLCWCVWRARMWAWGGMM